MTDTQIIPQPIIIISDSFDFAKQQTLSSKFKEIEKTQPMRSYCSDTVIDRAARGEVPMLLILDAIDDEVEKWHEDINDMTTSLHEFIGMSWQEYMEWFKNPKAIYDIVEARANLATSKTQSIEVLDVIALYKPIDAAEHHLIRMSNYTRFPKQKQTFFHPFLHDENAIEVAKDNTTVGFVAKFHVSKEFISKFNIYCGHYNVPAVHLDKMNAEIVGQIQIIHTFFGSSNAK